MIGSPRVRAARKTQQLDRLAAKENDPEGYVDYYANMPSNKVRSEKATQIRGARADLRTAVEDLQVAEIDGVGLLSAQEAATVATLVVEKLVAAARPTPHVHLTAVGGP